MAKKSAKTPPRPVPSRDDWYMGQAFWIASKSKDPATQNGAIIVSTDNIPIGTGYNGPPETYDDEEVDWSRPAKYPHIVHAEDNAIAHCPLPFLLPGSTLYVTARPCKDCMLLIANRKISRIVYFPLHLCSDPESMLAKDAELVEDIAKRTKGKVVLEQFKGNLNWMRDRMMFFEKLGIF